jgi:hypothetical protein
LDPQPSDLESDALAVRATGLCLSLLMYRMFPAMSTVFFQLKFFSCIFLIFHAGIISVFALCALE